MFRQPDRIHQRGGQFWTPITPQRGSIFHADLHVMSCRTQVGTEKWFLRSNKGIVASEPARYRPIRPTDHKLMRASRVSFHEQKWVRSCERRGVVGRFGG